jgi:hypothetical protein
MRIVKSLCLAAGLVIGLVVPALVAQGGFVIVGNGSSMHGEPYTATLKTTRVQTLADGTKITHTTVVKEARDSAGRTYQDSHNELPGGSGGDFDHVRVVDPINRETIVWDTRSKEATVFHIPDPRQAPPDMASAPKVQANMQPPQTHPETSHQVEDLGTETINGVVATGRRVTNVIPAGKQGNDQPITITVETWNSNELRILVRRIEDDPRSGLTTTKLTDLQQGEPDPALFQPPDGYTVKEQLPGQNQN